jgi:hypothetical protein
MITKLKLKDNLTIKGHSRLTVWDAITGNPIPEDCRDADNLIISYEDLADVLIGNSEIAYCGVGSGTKIAELSDEDLQVPIGARKVVTTATRSGALCMFSTFFSSTENNGTWNESCLALRETGHITNRAVYANPFYKNSGKQVQNDWTIEVKAI